MRQGDAGASRTADGLLHDERALRASIASELADLFNTRVPVAIGTLDHRERSTVDYGISDLSAFPVGETAAMARLSNHLRDAIVAYEPRIHAPAVAIQQSAGRAGTLIAVVSGTIELHMMQTKVMFELPLDAAATDDHAL